MGWDDIHQVNFVIATSVSFCALLRLEEKFSLFPRWYFWPIFPVMLQLSKHYPDTNSSEGQQVWLHYNSNHCQQENSRNFSLIDQAGRAWTGCYFLPPRGLCAQDFPWKKEFLFHTRPVEIASSQSQLLDHLLVPTGNSLQMPVPEGWGSCCPMLCWGAQGCSCCFVQKITFIVLDTISHSPTASYPETCGVQIRLTEHLLE